MKKMISTLLFTFLSLNVFAVTEADYSARHITKIKNAIANKCNLKGKFVFVAAVVEDVSVDQGILDYDYLTVFKHRDWIDQGVFDDYSIEVTSHYSHVYDFADSAWGQYNVSNVKCTLAN